MNRRTLFKQIFGVLVGTQIVKASPSVAPIVQFQKIPPVPDIQNYEELKAALANLAASYSGYHNTPEVQSNLRSDANSILYKAIQSRIVCDYSIVCDKSNNMPPQVDQFIRLEVYLKITRGINFKYLRYHIYRN